MNARLQKTTNYNLFAAHEYNRPLHNTKGLMASMVQYGFMPSSPLHCVRNGGSKLKVIRGHHRLYCAIQLKLPVYYIIDDSNSDLFALEGDSAQMWSVSDFTEARAEAGQPDYAKLLSFKNAHRLTIGSAASLVGGEMAGSNNKLRHVRNGTFTCGNMDHAYKVVAITDMCLNLELPFATSSAFVAAVSLALRVERFDSDHFCHKLELHHGSMSRRGRYIEYLEEIEAIYNYGARADRRIPLKHEAMSIGTPRRAKKGGAL